MKLLVITSPVEEENEAGKINRLFDEGLQILHLRKPDWESEKYELLLKKIAPQHYKKIVIHSHFKLIGKYNLKGIHLKSRMLLESETQNIKEAFRLAAKRNLTISASMHSLQQLRENKRKFDYVFLSPVFDSISKKGYSAAFDMEEVRTFLAGYNSPVEVMALGGVHEGNIQQLVSCGFSGAALLGNIWCEGESLEQFRKIKKIIVS